jgi:hypothetical protein
MLPSLEPGAELRFPYALAIADDPDWRRQCDDFGALCDGHDASIEWRFVGGYHAFAARRP